MNVIPRQYARIPRYIVRLSESEVGILTGFRETTNESDIPGTRLHTVKEGESFVSLALRYYNVPEYWFVLAEVNPEIAYPLDLRDHIGDTIKIPPPSYVKNNY